MKRSVRNLFIGLGFTCLFGCVSTATETAPQTVDLAGEAVSEVPQSGLGPQQLAPGECGLFLWSKTDTSSFIFFSRAASGDAVFRPEDERLDLQQVGAGGTIFGQFNTEQRYTSSDGGAVELTFEAGESLSGGQRISDGLITMTDVDGWRTKLPVLGLRACMPEE